MYVYVQIYIYAAMNQPGFRELLKNMWTTDAEKLGKSTSDTCGYVS